MSLFNPASKKSDTQRSPMSAMDGFVYNFLTMGPMFPWVYLSGLAAFPSASIPLALLIALGVEIPICFAYSWLSQRSGGDGGDYLFQAEAFGIWGAAIVFSGFVVWPLQWVATLGWLVAVAGIAPMFYVTGAALHSRVLIDLGRLVQSRYGIVVVSVCLVYCAWRILERDLHSFARLQRVLFIITACALMAIILLFTLGSHGVVSHFDEFARQLATLSPVLHISELRVVDLRDLLIFDTLQHAYEPHATFSWLGTFAIVPIAWTSLQWATFSVEQNSQIGHSRSLWSHMRMMAVAAITVTLLMIAVAYAEVYAFGGSEDGAALIRALAAAQDAGRDYASPSLSDFMRHVLEPFPNVLAMASTGSIALALLIGLGLIANAFQVLCSCSIGAAYIVRRMAVKGDLPGWPATLRLLSVSTNECKQCEGEITSRHSHVGIYAIYAFSSVPIILAYNLVPEWSRYTLGLTFACGYVFMFTALSAFVLSRRDQASTNLLLSRTAGRAWRDASSLLGVLLAATLLGMCLVISQLGLNGTVPMLYTAVVFLLSLLLVWRSRRAHKPAVIELSAVCEIDMKGS